MSERISRFRNIYSFMGSYFIRTVTINYILVFLSLTFWYINIILIQVDSKIIRKYYFSSSPAYIIALCIYKTVSSICFLDSSSLLVKIYLKANAASHEYFIDVIRMLKSWGFSTHILWYSLYPSIIEYIKFLLSSSIKFTQYNISSESSSEER